MKSILAFFFLACGCAGSVMAIPNAIELNIAQSKLFESFSSSHNKKYLDIEESINRQIDKGKYDEAYLLSEKLEEMANSSSAKYWIGASLYYKGVIKYRMYEDAEALNLLLKLEGSIGSAYMKDKHNKLKVLAQIGKIYKSDGETNKALIYFKKSLEFERYSKGDDNPFFIYLNMGIIYSSQRKFSEAKKCYIKCIKVCVDATLPYLQNVYNNLGVDEFEQRNYAEAIRWYVKSMAACDKVKDLDNISFAYNNIGAIYMKGLRNDAKALFFYNKSLEIEKKLNNTEGIALELTNIGSVYSSKGDLQNAKKYFSEAYELYKKIGNSREITPLLLKYGDVYKEEKNYEKAIQYYIKAVETRGEKGNAKGLTLIQYKIGGLYFLQGKNVDARRYLEDALKNNKANSDIDLESKICYDLSQVCVAQSDLRTAYKYMQSYDSLKNLIFNSSVSEQIIDIQEKYEKSEMEQKVQMQNLEIASKSMQRNAMLAILLLSVVVSSGFVYFVFQKRKNEKLLYEKNNAIKDSEIKHLMQESELRSMASAAEGQEQERKRISRDLHDRVGSMLSLIKLNLSSCDKDDAEMKKNLELVEQTYQEVRSISHNLYSGIVDTLGLKVALQELKKSIESKSTISFNIAYYDDVPALTKEQEDVVYRVVQELVTNTLKYADAKNIDIQINSDEEGDIAIMVEDDGKGFDPKKKSEGIGLTNIRYRLSTINATFEVSASIGHGACFILNIPHKEKKVNYEYSNC